MINKNLLVAEKPLKVKVVAVRENHVKLSFSDQQMVEINKKYLPSESKVGDELYLSLLSESGFAKTKKEVAKELLEDILSKDEV